MSPTAVLTCRRCKTRLVRRRYRQVIGIPITHTASSSYTCGVRRRRLRTGRSPERRADFAYPVRLLLRQVGSCP